MKLHYVLVERSVNSRIDFKSLSEINQRQLLIGLCKWHGKRIPLSKAFKLNFQANYWHVIESNNCENILYEYWEINREYGVFFQPNTASLQGIYSNGRLIQDRYCSKSLSDLSAILSTAERLDCEISKFNFDNKGQVIGFKSTLFVPDSISKWRSLLKRVKVSSGFIYTYSRYFDKKCWRTVGQYSDLTMEVMRLYGKKIGWQIISSFQHLDQTLVAEFRDELDWRIISSTRKLSESFMREYSNVLSWEDISIHQDLSINFIEEFKSKINFRLLKTSSLEVVYEFQEQDFNWLDIVTKLDIDERFVRKFWLKFDDKCKEVVCFKCKLSTDFLCEYRDKIDWVKYSQNRFISDEQVLLFKERIDWNILSTSGCLPAEETLLLVQDFINSHKDDARIIWLNIFKNDIRYAISDSYKLNIVEILNSIVKAN